MKKQWERIFERLRAKEHLLVWMAFGIGTLLSLMIAGAFSAAGQAQQRLYDTVVRFHVLANSDSAEDQAVKYQVKDAVIAYLQERLEGMATREETEALLCEEADAIRRVAETAVRRAGDDVTVTVTIADSSFPTKRYGSVTLPAGTYRALRIELGEAQGANWWCMMFPALCFVEETDESLPEETEKDLSKQLPEAENELIHQDTAGVRLRIRFKLIEWWAALFG
jgi:stage II sporulation protein R